jgi:hypothetical protein
LHTLARRADILHEFSRLISFAGERHSGLGRVTGMTRPRA